MTITFTNKERQAAVKQAAQMVDDIKGKVLELENLCDQFGIRINLNIAGLREQTYHPRRPAGVTEDDVYDSPVPIDWVASEDEDTWRESTYIGWSNSSTFC